MDEKQMFEKYLKTLKKGYNCPHFLLRKANNSCKDSLCEKYFPDIVQRKDCPCWALGELEAKIIIRKEAERLGINMEE